VGQVKGHFGHLKIFEIFEIMVQSVFQNSFLLENKLNYFCFFFTSIHQNLKKTTKKTSI
jgi:hypothetical protein